MQLIQKILSVNGEEIFCEYDLKEINAVIFHGAGTSELARFYPIAEELIKGGVGVILFDFSGHGRSSGKLSEQSLEKRKQQAQTVIDKIAPKGDLYLIGFSMGAQTLCDILAAYQDRVPAVLLGCPAIYSEEARNIDFGNKEFTSILRRENSWENSESPNILRNFGGKTTIAVGGRDEVIPKGVVYLLRNAAKNLAYIEYEEADHMLAGWLGKHPKELSELIDNLV